MHVSQYYTLSASTEQIQNQQEHSLVKQYTKQLNALKRLREEKYSTATYPLQYNSNRQKSKNTAHLVEDGWKTLASHLDSLQTSSCSLHEEKEVLHPFRDKDLKEIDKSFCEVSSVSWSSAPETNHQTLHMTTTPIKYDSLGLYYQKQLTGSLKSLHHENHRRPTI